MSARELPALTTAEAGAVLRRLGDLTSAMVLVGGQALAFWVDYYASRLSLSGPVNSKDIDFCGSAKVVASVAQRLGGTHQLPEPFSNTPNTGLVEFLDPSGHLRRIDFLGHPYGLDYEAVLDWAVDVDVPMSGDVVSFKVMHPVHCVQSRISNVGGLPGYQTAHALTQARASLSCAHEYLRDLLDADAIRVVLDMNEHLYRFAWGDLNARNVAKEHGIDAFTALLVDDRLPRDFLTKRYPDMQRRLAWRRKTVVVGRAP